MGHEARILIVCTGNVCRSPFIEQPLQAAAQLVAHSGARQVTGRAAARRGLNPPLAPAQADIVDPFRREDAVFAGMAPQIVGLMPAVVRALVG